MIDINRDMTEMLASLYIECDKFSIKVYLQDNELYLYKKGSQVKQAPFTIEGIEFLIKFINL